MNVQETRFRIPDSLEHGASFQERVAVVAFAAAADAEEVDREARFPRVAIDAAREHKLLGAQIPVAFGGLGASIFDITDMCYTLGRACSSTAMIFAMHQIKVACLVRHGSGSSYHEALMRRVASEQLLLASSTTEGQNGGNIRSSAAAVEHNDAEISLIRKATVISYGAEADGIVSIARRAGDAASSDQVLVAFTKDNYTLERCQSWETLGMRGTCSAGFELKATASADQIFPEAYEKISYPDYDAGSASVLVVRLGRYRCGRRRPCAAIYSQGRARGRRPASARCRALHCRKNVAGKTARHHHGQYGYLCQSPAR